jgi:hypothetical protein
MDVDGALRAVAQLGLAVTLALALWYVVLMPRGKGKERRSSLLVPGWIHDEKRAEVEAVRRFYETALKDEQNRAQVRVQEWRGFREEAVAKQKDAEDDRRELIKAVTTLQQDVGVLLEITRRAAASGVGAPAEGRDHE